MASSGGLYAGAFPLLLIALISVRERDAAATGLAASGARRGIAGMRERGDGCGGPLTAADCGWWQVFGGIARSWT